MKIKFGFEDFNLYRSTVTTLHYLKTKKKVVSVWFWQHWLWTNKGEVHDFYYEKLCESGIQTTHIPWNACFIENHSSLNKKILLMLLHKKSLPIHKTDTDNYWN